MKLYITPGSPYARMVRIFILEKGLSDRVEIVIAQTRQAGSPYYAINPSGRVPYLVRDDGVGLEESMLIIDYLDQLDGKPMLSLPHGKAGWEARRLEALARSFADGLAVWSRELARAAGERSPTTIKHEAARAERMADLWESQINHAWMNGPPSMPINMARITLACALGHASRIADLRWRDGRPQLSAWFDAFARRPSFQSTAVTARA
jgi:glutathione S-transferase